MPGPPPLRIPLLFPPRIGLITGSSFVGPFLFHDPDRFPITFHLVSMFSYAGEFPLTWRFSPARCFSLPSPLSSRSRRLLPFFHTKFSPSIARPSGLFSPRHDLRPCRLFSPPPSCFPCPEPSRNWRTFPPPFFFPPLNLFFLCDMPPFAIFPCTLRFSFSYSHSRWPLFSRSVPPLGTGFPRKD